MSPDRIFVTFLRVPAVAIRFYLTANGDIFVTDLFSFLLLITINLGQLSFIFSFKLISITFFFFHN